MINPGSKTKKGVKVILKIAAIRKYYGIIKKKKEYFDLMSHSTASQTEMTKKR